MRPSVPWSQLPLVSAAACVCVCLCEATASPHPHSPGDRSAKITALLAGGQLREVELSLASAPPPSPRNFPRGPDHSLCFWTCSLELPKPPTLLPPLPPAATPTPDATEARELLAQTAPTPHGRGFGVPLHRRRALLACLSPQQQ